MYQELGALSQCFRNVNNGHKLAVAECSVVLLAWPSGQSARLGSQRSRGQAAFCPPPTIARQPELQILVPWSSFWYSISNVPFHGMACTYNPGQKVWDTAFFPNSCNIRLLSPSPHPSHVGWLFGKPFLMNNIAWGEGRKVEFGPKNVCFCVKTDWSSKQCILQVCPT